MRIGVCVVELYIPGVASLKGKRSIIQSVTKRLKNRFNVSVAEIGAHDLYQRTAIGIAVIGNDPKKLNSVLDRVLGFIEKQGETDLIDYQIRIL